MQNINKIKSMDKFKYITQKGKNYLSFLRAKIAPYISEPLAQYMLDFCLSPQAHHNTLKLIKNQFLSPLTPSNNPTIHIVLGQTGAGKSTLAKELLQNHPNTLLIDQDLYKSFHPLSKLILMFSK